MLEFLLDVLLLSAIFVVCSIFVVFLCTHVFTFIGGLYGF